MKICNALCTFMILSNATIILAMQNDDTPLSRYQSKVKEILEKKPEHVAHLKLHNDLTRDVLSHLSQCDDNMQCNAYAAAIHCNDVLALHKLETAKIPVPTKDNLTLMMRYYALPCNDSAEKDILAGVSKNPLPTTDYVHPKHPRFEALLWCLDHNADPNGEYFSPFITYSPLSPSTPLDPFQLTRRRELTDPLPPQVIIKMLTDRYPHPLYQIVKYLTSPYYEPALQMIKKRGARFSPPDDTLDCAHLIRYALQEEIGSEKPSTELQMIRVSAILETYKKIVIDADTATLIKTLINVGPNHPDRYLALSIKKKLESSTQESIDAQIRKEQRTAWLKSLFCCGGSAEQTVHPMNN